MAPSPFGVNQIMRAEYRPGATLPFDMEPGSQRDIYLDTYMLHSVYYERGICVRDHCGAEPPRDTEPPGHLASVGGRDRAATSYAAADCVQAPASAAGG